MFISGSQDGRAKIWDVRVSPNANTSVQGTTGKKGEKGRHICKYVQVYVTIHIRIIIRIHVLPLIRIGGADGSVATYRDKHLDAFSIRDIEFNPVNPLLFACAYDNGAIAIWDVRMPRQLGT